MNGKWEVKERDRKGMYVNNNKKIIKTVLYVSKVTLQSSVMNHWSNKLGIEFPDTNGNTYKASRFQCLLLVILWNILYDEPLCWTKEKMEAWYKMS